MRRVGVGVAMALVLAVAIWSLRRPVPPPSLLLVTIDTLRADRVGAYGSTAGLTPALDGLAARGWVFEDAVSPVPLTLPSHATLLSGLDPLHHGVHNNGTFVFPEGKETLATRLKAAGYATGAFLAAVVLDHRFGLARGFDEYDDRIIRAREGRSVLESERSCEEVSRKAITWIQAQSGPFFAWVHIYEPHAPYAPPKDLADSHPGRPYDAEVAAADRCLATLLRATEGASPGGFLAAVTSDHGEGLGDHGETTHGLFVYQSTLAVPMVIAGPGVPPGKRSSSLATSADLAPTLLGLMRVKALSGVDGRNLASEPGSGEAYAETDYPTGFGWAGLRAYRLGGLKLIEAPQVELFDLIADPGEQRNLAIERPADVERLRGVLNAAMASQVQAGEKRLSREAEEQLRSLGYVAGRPSQSNPATALDPKAALPLFQSFERAMANELAGDYGAAVRELLRLTRLDPGNVLFERSLASALGRNGQADEALAVLTAAAGRTPDDADLIHDLAVALAERGRLDEAIRVEETALTLDPGLVDVLDHLAILKARVGDFAAARSAVEKALSLDPNNAAAWSNRGNILRAQGKSHEAERSYRRAISLAPDLVDALNGLGVLSVEGGRLDEAARFLEEAIGQDPGFDEARLNLAVVESQRGNSKRAAELSALVARQASDPSLRARAHDFATRLLTPSN